MLKIENLEAFYGHVKAVKKLELGILKGEIFSIIGPNGAGKTTLLRAIGGFHPPKVKGKIIFKDKDITRLRPNERAKMGLSVLLEGKRVFPGLTVKDNLMVGSYLLRKKKSRVKENFDFVLELFPVLKEKLKQRAGILSGGEQQMLAIGRALMASPDFLCLDEPSFGLAPKVVEAIFKTLSYLSQEKNITILLVEQDVALALKFADRCALMVSGEKRLEGHSKEMLEKKTLINLYLGGYHDRHLES